MSTINNIINLNIFYKSALSSPNILSTIEILDISFVSAVLIFLIVISLTLTFNSSGTAVHKVLGLLMVSIFVVFLWMLQTQFLFIYIVYVMAFISAVLMLFLSVVLMLPISTITTKSYFNVPKTGVSSFVVLVSQFSDVNLFHTFVLDEYSITSVFIVLLLVLLYSIYDFTVNDLTLKLLSLTKLSMYIRSSFKHFVEAYVQTYLYFSIVSSMFTLVIIKQDWFTHKTNLILIDSNLSLSQIKDLLYGDYSYFLIFSTIVLLVALLGAAVMTRDTYSRFN